jgi:hypothetical protein
VVAAADEEKEEEKEAARWRELARLVAKRIADAEGLVMEWDANERSMVWVLTKPRIAVRGRSPYLADDPQQSLDLLFLGDFWGWFG